MSDSQRPAVAGRAYLPELDVPPAGTGPGDDLGAGRLRSLPRRRRPVMIALAVAMAGTGVVASAAIYQRAGHQVPVVMVTRAVAAGGVITASDLGTASVAVGSDIKVIAASRVSQIAGQVAAVALQPATLLAPSQVTASEPPLPGQELVAAAVKPADLPATGLRPGDEVLIVATPGDQGLTGAPSSAPLLISPARGSVEAVTRAPDADGFDVVDLLVSSDDAIAVAGQVSTGQFALIVTRRG